MKIKIIFLMLIIYNNALAQDEEDNSRVEASINIGAQTNKEKFAIGGNLKYVNRSHNLNIFYPTFSIGYYVGVDDIFNIDLSLFGGGGGGGGSDNTYLIPIMVGSKIGKGKQYFSGEVGFVQIIGPKNLNAFCFAMEGVVANLDNINVACKYNGNVGKDNFYLGVASLQLTFKF